jgi:hypothetical protein
VAKINSRYSLSRIKKGTSGEDVGKSLLSRRVGVSRPWFQPMMTVDSSAQLLVDTMATQLAVAAPQAVLSGSSSHLDLPAPWMGVDAAP